MDSMAAVPRQVFWTLMLLLITTGVVHAGVRSPLAGHGDFDFVADAPVFPAEDGGARVDLSLRLDHSQIRFRPAHGEPFLAEVEVHLKVAQRGIVAVDTVQVYELVAESLVASTDPLLFQLVEIPFRVDPGTWAVTLEVFDRQAARDKTFQSSIESSATGVLVVPRWGEDRRLSDPEFRLRSGGRSLPNPERVFGVVQDTLEVYFEVVGVEPGRSETVVFEVVDPAHGNLDRQEVRFVPDSTRHARLYRLPVGAFPEGTYVLRMIPSWGEGKNALESEFVVAWKMGRFAEPSRDLELEAQLVLPADKHQQFRKLSSAAQSQMLADFWESHDPTPGTSRNETYDRFRERMAYAWRFLGESMTPGPLTDRGQIYVRYGPPAGRDVQVLPTNADDLNDAIDAVHDTYALHFEGVIAREATRQDNPLQRSFQEIAAGKDQRRDLARIGSEGSFELWEYDFDGDPLFAGSHWSENVDLRFLFVDRRGDGSYRLEFSNMPTRF